MPHQLNAQLRELLAEARLTYQAAAQHVRAVAAENGLHGLRTNKSAVHHWVRGAVPEETTARCLAEALSRRLGRPITRADLGLPTAASAAEDDSIGLSLGPDPVEVLQMIGEADVHRRRFLTTSAYSMAAATLPLQTVQETARRTAAARGGAVAGTAEVNAVRDMVRLFADMDERHGGQHGRSAFAQYLITDIAALCRARFRTDTTRRRMLSVASAAAHLAGWKAYDSGEQGLAQRYFLQSYALAAESGEPGQAPFVLRTMSQHGMKLHRPQHCLDLADTALTRARGQVAAPVEALFHITHAHALAKTGQRPAAVTGIERARAALDTGYCDDVPFWALAWGPPQATVLSRTAKVLETLGDHPRAAQHYARAAASRPTGTYARIIALDLTAQAESALRQGHLEQACATWHRAIDHMDGVASTRTRSALADIRRHLTPYRSRRLHHTTQLDERVRHLLHPATPQL
ncbi:hypothetical protein RM780_10015 [Streptomyces sp. DSM 44917]|uniref:Transcriptional regulator n=1 Tax=Streptomyces boetiae TaxID=3075541 RepID=A0ABU2L7W2_9ACTN|nr:hypothetical protein [Streptomyces sp. DSM 44917]MDT0307298.1 hypothetical protein [Streptomyces sp. DSM 44917]